MISILDAMSDPELFGEWFRGPSWDTWRAVLKATFGLPMDGAELGRFTLVAERSPPTKPVRELWCVIGRRGGKTGVASGVAAHRSALCDHRRYLRPGERATAMLLAVDRVQAAIALRYTAGFFAQPLLAGLITRETQDTLELSNGNEVSVYANNYKTIRGRTVCCAILDECAFYPDLDASLSADETYTALVPATATIPNALIVGISTPYKRSGLLYDKWKAHFGKSDDDVLVVQGSSRQFNPTIDQKIVDDALAKDPEAAGAEWLGLWRRDISAFIDRGIVDSVVIPASGDTPSS
jgi:hypothetical protein